MLDGGLGTPPAMEVLVIGGHGKVGLRLLDILHVFLLLLSLSGGFGRWHRQ